MRAQPAVGGHARGAGSASLLGNFIISEHVHLAGDAIISITHNASPAWSQEGLRERKTSCRRSRSAEMGVVPVAPGYEIAVR